MTEPAQQPTTPAATPPAATPDTSGEATFTQAELNRIAANEKRDGRNSVLAELGVDDLDSLKEIVTTYTEAQAEAQTDLDKAEADRDKYKGERDEVRQTLNQERIGFRLEAALRDAGVPSDRLADALALADRSALAIEKDGSVTGLDDAVKATLEPRSWLTEAQQQEQTPRRAADVSRQVAPTSSDPQQLHGQFLASLLGNNSP